MFDKTFKRLKTFFIIFTSISVVAFIADVLYTSKYVMPIENPTLERWCIIITLFGIFSSLKFLHPKLNETEKKNPVTAIKVYTKKYYFRLFILVAIFLLNIVCLHFTGVKNFLFLALITIFAYFLCMPNKQQIKAETEEVNN